MNTPPARNKTGTQIIGAVVILIFLLSFVPLVVFAVAMYLRYLVAVFTLGWRLLL